MMVVHCVYHLGFLHFGFAQGEDHGGNLQTVRYAHAGFNMPTHWFGLTFAQSYFSSFLLLVFCKCRKGKRSSVAFLLWDPNIDTCCYGKPMS